MNVRHFVVGVMAIASGALAVPAHADVIGIGSCSVSTYYTYTQACTFVPTGTQVWFSCDSINGGIGTIAVAQDVFVNTQSCPTHKGPNTVVPGVPVTVTLTQTGGFLGWLEGQAYSVL